MLDTIYVLLVCPQHAVKGTQALFNTGVCTSVTVVPKPQPKACIRSVWSHRVMHASPQATCISCPTRGVAHITATVCGVIGA